MQDRQTTVSSIPQHMTGRDVLTARSRAERGTPAPQRSLKLLDAIRTLNMRFQGPECLGTPPSQSEHADAHVTMGTIDGATMERLWGQISLHLSLTGFIIGRSVRDGRNVGILCSILPPRRHVWTAQKVQSRRSLAIGYMLQGRI